MRTISVGLIGWGFMGRTHAQALRSLALFYPDAPFRVRLTCVCTRRLEAAQDAMRDAGFERSTDDWRELVAMPDIDVVSICTPNALHEEMAVAALRAGKHVYLDKPVSVTGESALRIAEAARSSPAHTRVAFNNRYLPATLRAKQLVDEGRLGEILQFEARYLHSGSIDAAKPIGWKQQLQGGVILDMGSHVLDLLTWLMGYPRRVFCRTRTLYPERPTRDGGVERALSEDHALMLLELGGGALGMAEASKIATGTNDDLTLEIRGTRGALRWELMQPNYLEFYDDTAPGFPIGGLKGYTRIETVGRYPAPGGHFLPSKNAVGWERGHLHCYYDFLDEVVNDRPGSCTIEQGARLQCLMDALKRSSAEERWVDV